MDSNRRLRWQIGLALAVMTLVVYAQVRRFEFTEFDDQIYVVHCSLVQKGLTADGVREAFTTFRASNWHPLTWLSLMADRQFFGNNAGAFHLTNLGLHLANVLLLFVALDRLTGAPWRSGLVAALFAIHPLHVESVAWVSERKDVLSTFFWMLVLWGYSHFVRQRSLNWYLFVCATFALGLLAKPMLVTLPCVLLLLDYWPLNRVRNASADAPPAAGKGRQKKSKAVPAQTSVSQELAEAIPAVTWRQACVEKLPLFVLALAACSVTLSAQRTSMSTTAQTALTYRLSNAVTAYARYLIQTIWPVRLAPFYPWKNIEWTSAWPIAATLLLIGVTLAVVRARRSPWLRVGWFWYLGTLVPVIGLVQVGTQALADRYTYIPLIGIFMMLAWSLPAEALTKRPAMTGAIAAVAVALAILMFLSWKQAGYWRDTRTLFEHALAVTEKNWMAHINLGTAAEKQGRIDEARRHYEQAWQINPKSAQANALLADMAMRRGDRDEARKRALEAIRISPETAEAQGILGLSYAAAGEFDAAIEHFQKAVRLVPDNPAYRYNLGLAYADSGRLSQAADEFRAMIRLKPDAAPGYHQLGIVLKRMGQTEQARESFRRAVQLDPRLEEETTRQLQTAP